MASLLFGLQDAFRRIDGGYAQTIGKLSKEAGIGHMLYVSSQGANAKSWFLYMQVKGQIEQTLEGLKFDKLTILQYVLVPPTVLSPVFVTTFFFLWKGINEKRIVDESIRYQSYNYINP